MADEKTLADKFESKFVGPWAALARTSAVVTGVTKIKLLRYHSDAGSSSERGVGLAIYLGELLRRNLLLWRILLVTLNSLH